MSRGVAVLILSLIAVVCIAVIVLAIRPELLVVIGLMYGGTA